MGGGMASHTSWRARGAAGGAGWGGREDTRARSQAGGGAGARGPGGGGGERTLPPQSPWGLRAERLWERRAQAPGQQHGPAGSCHQLPPEEGLLSRPEDTAGQGAHRRTPTLAPGSSQQEGVLPLSTHLASVSCSCPAPRLPSYPPPTRPRNQRPLPMPLATPRVDRGVVLSVPGSLDLPGPPEHPGLRALGAPSPQAPLGLC